MHQRYSYVFKRYKPKYNYDVCQFGYFPIRMNTLQGTTVDKTTANHQHIPLLHAVPPLAQFLYVLRRQGVCAQSCRGYLENSTGIGKIIVTGDVNLTFH